VKAKRKMKHKHNLQAANWRPPHVKKEQPVFYDKTFANKNEKKYELEIFLIQPWSVPVLKTTLPPDILQTMIKISDQIMADKNAKSWGEHLAGQVTSELAIDYSILEKTGVLGFFLGAIRQFVLICKCQLHPDKIDEMQQEEWLTDINNMWVVSQQPGEYNPLHIHTDCQISSVMYLKVPKMLPSKKEHRPNDDGSILFTSNVARDIDFSTPNIAIPPQVGDFYMFGAHQEHAVYPYRCEEGQEDVERRSISFNAVYKSSGWHRWNKI
jgi:hypothetical protein